MEKLVRLFSKKKLKIKNKRKEDGNSKFLPWLDPTLRSERPHVSSNCLGQPYPEEESKVVQGHWPCSQPSLVGSL